MCGTPFPSRELTVREARSTPAFTSVPVEAAVVASLPAPVREAASPEVLKVAEVSADVPAVVERDPQAETVAAARVVVVEEPSPQIVQAHSIEAAAAVQASGAAEAAVAEKEALDIEPVHEELVPEPPRAVHLEAQEVAGEAAVEWVGEHVAHIEPDAAEVPSVAQVAPETARTPRVHTPSPRVLVMPSPRPAPAVAEPTTPRPPHPSPDSIPTTAPPESAGMPTFQEINEAAGAPAISPFEPPVEKHPDEERELREYVASFHYAPPAETADELTMRSEVPDIDEAEPEEFHHPSFDDDVAPPPEAGPHPTGAEYYMPGGAARASRVLDLSHEPHVEGHGNQARSTLGLDELTSTPMPIDGVGAKQPRNYRGWWWVAALLALCGGLGFWEGRAHSTHAFRGPVELAREAYGDVRQRVAETKGAASTVAAPADTEAAQVPAKPAENGDANGKPAEAAPKPAETPNAQDSAAKETLVQTAPAAADQSAAKDSGEKPTVETIAAAPAKPIEAPVPRPSSKPQPGQQELNKAMEASDSAAAAAWLWKATSRGNPEAPVRLADMYIKGNGVPKSCEQGLVLLRSAATKENAPARNRLAALYANGTCVARDRVKAYQLMTSALAADPSSEWAKENRTALLNQMTPQERAEAVRPH
jgi:hypothetical protein